MLADLYGPATDLFLEGLGDLVSAEDGATIRDCVAATESWLLARPERFGLVHGDYRLDNLLFPPDGGDGVVAVDWQTLSLALPARDLAYFLGTGLDPATRATHERELVAAYHQAPARPRRHRLRPRHLLGRLPFRDAAGSAGRGVRLRVRRPHRSWRPDVRRHDRALLRRDPRPRVAHRRSTREHVRLRRTQCDRDRRRLRRRRRAHPTTGGGGRGRDRRRPRPGDCGRRRAAAAELDGRAQAPRPRSGSTSATPRRSPPWSDDVVARARRLDLMFNNAGITFGGETHELTLDHWNAIIDVNIRGVVHGVAAAYPLMVRAGPRPHRQHRLDGRADGGRPDHQLRDDQARRRRAVARPAHRGGRARGRRHRPVPGRGRDPDARQG